MGAIKGAVSTDDLHGIDTQVVLSNAYHLHVRPGDEADQKYGGLHKFMNWDGPILTDSLGAFGSFPWRVSTISRKEGVTFRSHIDGHKIYMVPDGVHADSVEPGLHDCHGL